MLEQLENMDSSEMSRKEQRRRVGILGTGDFSRALAKRLLFSGYDVILGSRKPEKKAMSAIDQCLCNVQLLSVEECIKSASIIFLAVHFDNVKELLTEHVVKLEGKILIDVSNRDRPSSVTSNAELVQKMVPSCKVVKAFNVISAYAMENDYNSSSKQVFISSNSEQARDVVANIAKDMNFRPVDFGGLFAARRIEKHPLRLFPEWRGPLGFAVGVFNVWLLYLIYIYYIADSVYKWEQLFVKVLNKAICMTGITTLSVTYLASSFATVFQIYYGTKHIRFSRWLDKWLKERKQLGLISFALISIHVIMSVLIMSPTYLSSWYHSTEITVPANLTAPFQFKQGTWMNWKGEAACLVGTIAYVVICFICATTFPSVTDTLNWREWRFVQSKMGHAALLLSVGHVLVMGLPGWLLKPHLIYKSITFLCSILPWITLLLKPLFSLPCVDRYVMKLSKGWERHEDKCKADCVRPVKHEGYVAIDMNADKQMSCQDACACPDDRIPMMNIGVSDCGCASDDLVLNVP
ncbi:metalloreductase STEAP4-like [Dreissena polymorpha]|uniref:metalloreductase STEAP4-like n=1 Tax=Dreissena polymorpha TaxID=45954 RepID=UPI002264E885|nr:metalloreductase STEAP4-like [Dreissena polymorpha]